MINVTIFRNNNKEIYGVKADDHGESIVCAGVSALVINMINSISNLTDEALTCDHNDDGGHIFIRLPNIEKGGHNHDVNLLLNSLVLGLNGIMCENPKHLIIHEIIDEEAR